MRARGGNDHLIPAIKGDPTSRLTEMQLAFVNNIIMGMPQTTAARTAGYTAPHVEASRLIRKPFIKEAIQMLNRKHEKASQMTRKKVMDGMLEAIEMAKIQGESGVMVAGWREVGRMCGYYAAEHKVIDVNITAKRAIDKMETLSDAELLEMIEEDEAALEGEFTELLDTPIDETDVPDPFEPSPPSEFGDEFADRA